MSQDKINFKLERVSKLRGIRLLVLPNCTIVVRCSRSESSKNIVSFVLKNQNWIEKSLKKYEDLPWKYPQKMFVEGEKFIFMGKVFGLHFEKGHKEYEVVLKEDLLVVFIPSSSWSSEFSRFPQYAIRKHILKFYDQAAKKVLLQRIKALSLEMDLLPKKISFRSQRSLWGSCTPKGHIQLNKKLILAPLSVIDYVIIHELMHLRHLNHSKQFWLGVETYCPDYKKLRRWLKDNHYAFDFFNEVSEIHMSKIE